MSPKLSETSASTWSALPGEGIGGFLRRTREHLGIPIAQVSFTTRIPVASLKLIEDGRFESLPGETFARGFVRAYAGAIGLPAADAIRLFDGRRRGPEEVVLRPPVPAELRSRKVGVAFAFLILLVVLTLILSLVLRGTGETSQRDLTDRSAPTVPEVGA